MSAEWRTRSGIRTPTFKCLNCGRTTTNWEFGPFCCVGCESAVEL